MSTETTRPGRRLRLFLGLSLGLNLLFVGALAGAVLRHGPGLGEGRGASVGGALTRALDPEDRRAILHEMRREGRASGGREMQRASWEALLADVRAVPFDPQVLADRLAAHRAITQQRFELGQRLLVERLSQMSDAERAAYADRIEAQPRKRQRQAAGRALTVTVLRPQALAP